MNVSINKFRPSNIYFFLCFLGYLITPAIPSFRTGVFATLLLLAVALEIGNGVIKSENKSDFISLLNITVLLYFVYNIFSVIWIILNGYPISLFVMEFSNSILPIVFFFVPVYMKINDRWENINQVYRAFLVAFLILSFVCIVLYITAPQWYCDYLFNMSYISKADASTARVRMEGVTGSTCISFLGVAAMLVCARFMYACFNADASTSEKRKIVISKQFIGYTALFVYSLAVVFLANGRAGMVVALLIIVYINFLVFLTFKFLDRKYLYIEIAAVVVIVIGMVIAVPGAALKIWARLVSLPGAVGQRSEQWVSAINNMPAQWWGQWFGNGLGANGHKAIGIEGAHVVPDGGLVKLYCEEGAIGFSLLVFILLKTFKKGIKELKNYFAELGIVAAVLLMSIGSNIIAFQLCVPIFYFAIGVVLAEKNTDGKLDGGDK